MTVFNDTWRFLVQRQLWPVAILLIAAAAAVPMLLAKEPAAPAGPAAAAAVKSDEDVRARRPSRSSPPPATATAAGRRHVLGSPKNPFKPQRHPDADADAAAPSGGGPRRRHGATDERRARPARRRARWHPTVGGTPAPARRPSRAPARPRRSTSSTS